MKKMRTWGYLRIFELTDNHYGELDTFLDFVPPASACVGHFKKGCCESRSTAKKELKISFQVPTVRK